MTSNFQESVINTNTKIEIFGLEETLKVIQLQLPHHGQDHLPLLQEAQICKSIQMHIMYKKYTNA